MEDDYHLDNCFAGQRGDMTKFCAGNATWATWNLTNCTNPEPVIYSIIIKILFTINFFLQHATFLLAILVFCFSSPPPIKNRKQKFDMLYINFFC